jgi:hypothetical protein
MIRVLYHNPLNRHERDILQTDFKGEGTGAAQGRIVLQCPLPDEK